MNPRFSTFDTNEKRSSVNRNLSEIMFRFKNESSFSTDICYGTLHVLGREILYFLEINHEVREIKIWSGRDNSGQQFCNRFYDVTQPNSSNKRVTFWPCSWSVLKRFVGHQKSQMGRIRPAVRHTCFKCLSSFLFKIVVTRAAHSVAIVIVKWYLLSSKNTTYIISNMTKLCS